MGAWGTALYSNDTASDIRGDYVDLLRRGNQKPREKTVVEKGRCNCMGWEKTKINWTIEKETIDLYLAWQEHDNA